MGNTARERAPVESWVSGGWDGYNPLIDRGCPPLSGGVGREREVESRAHSRGSLGCFAWPAKPTLRTSLASGSPAATLKIGLLETTAIVARCPRICIFLCVCVFEKWIFNSRYYVLWLIFFFFYYFAFEGTRTCATNEKKEVILQKKKLLSFFFCVFGFVCFAPKELVEVSCSYYENANTHRKRPLSLSPICIWAEACLNETRKIRIYVLPGKVLLV